MHLQPSEILYSQDSISNTFDQKCMHSSYLIGETLDDICEGRCSVEDIPTISVVDIDGEWITRDNRRLWVFRHLERLGVCDEVPVKIARSIPEAKLTAFNGGQEIRVRRNPGGRWYKARKPKRTSRGNSYKQIHNTDEYVPSRNAFSDISNQKRSNYTPPVVTCTSTTNYSQSTAPTYNYEYSSHNEKDQECCVIL